jgi:hypothetical protein
MSTASKTTSLQAYNMVLFRNAVHPEFFQIEGRRPVRYNGYEFEVWISRGGHVLRFEYAGTCMSEVVTESLEGMPDRGHVATLPCAGEKDHECEFGDKVIYMTSMQTETLSDHLYLGTYNELMDHARACDGLLSVWTDAGGKPNMSMVDLQRYNDQMHVQAYHLRSDCGLVLRTQSIMQVKEPVAIRKA